jgi:hypothetical protein
MSNDDLLDRVRDTTGLANFIVDGLPKARNRFYAFLLDEVAERAGIEFQPNRKTDPKRLQVLQRLAAEGLDLTVGVEDAVLRMYTEAGREGPWAQPLTAFLRARKITLTPLRRRLVLQELDRLDLDPTSGQDFDQTIAAAVARVTAAGGTDPVQLTAPSGRLSPWDFQVDLFDSVANQIILEANVRAAGALMWCYDIGERLGVYRLTDALVYRWWIGELDFGDSDLTAQLYRNYKLRDERPSQTERFLLYKRILNIGNAPVGHRVVVNEEFPQLWRTLMEEVAIFIDKSESSFRDNQVNRQGVEQAVQEVAYNLTQSMAGMALTQVTEMYNQLTQTDLANGDLGGLDLMRHPEVIAQLSSGRRRDEWAVIERLAREEFGVVPNISATRTSAVEGFKVIDFIATFQPGRSEDTRFEQFIASAKAWILAHNVAGEGLLATMPEDEYGEDDEFADFDEDAIDAELADDGATAGAWDE